MRRTKEIEKGTGREGRTERPADGVLGKGRGEEREECSRRGRRILEESR